MSKEQYPWDVPFYEANLDWIETDDWDNFTAGLTFIDKLIQKLKPKTQAAYAKWKKDHPLKVRYRESEKYIYRALLEAKQNDLSSALFSCLEARKMCPENFRTWLLLAEVFRAMGDRKECKETLRVFLDYANDEIVTQGTPWRDLEPVRRISHFAYVLGMLYSQDKDYVNAKKYLRIAQKNNYENDPKIVLAFAEILHNQGNHKKAIIYLENLIKFYPDYLKAIELIAREHFVLDQMEKAEPYLEHILEIKPDSLNAIDKLLLIHKDQAGSEKTRKYVEHGLKYFPENLFFKSVYGLYLLSNQYYEEAKTYFEDVLETEPHNASILVSLAYCEFQTCGIIDIGRDLSKIIKEEEPDLYKEIIMDFNSFSKEILDLVRKALEINPDLGLGWLIRGLLEGMRGKKKLAKKYLKTAYKLQPGLRNSGKSENFIKKIMELGDSA